MTRVTLYTKPGCHLCDDVAQVIALVRRARQFELEIRDIFDDEGDFQLYQHEIPVVKVNGAEIARHRMSAQTLESALDAADHS